MLSGDGPYFFFTNLSVIVRESSASRNKSPIGAGNELTSMVIVGHDETFCLLGAKLVRAPKEKRRDQVDLRAISPHSYSARRCLARPFPLGVMSSPNDE